MSGRVLLVEDDASLREVAATVLESQGYSVEAASDGAAGLDAFRARPFDLVLLDVMLPGLDGFSLCREIRRHSNVPIVMLTARRETHDVVAGLELGADDYVTKPFEAPELIARVRAVLRRTGGGADNEVLETGDLRIDVNAYRAWRGGEDLPLTSTEFKLLVELVRHAGQVLSRDQLLQLVWGYDYLGDSRLVDMAVKRLRDKIEPEPAEPTYIGTVRGVGYRFERSVS
ncbi:MAG TPA: response regulator transcription factor [Acidimicrobiales bacterium]|jgi:two-component system, OmpR family, response regulator MtrA|nr:response regulator transcription factor [Acidimicrobiales bacterium]